jgi:hypothetical protein
MDLNSEDLKPSFRNYIKISDSVKLFERNITFSIKRKHLTKCLPSKKFASPAWFSITSGLENLLQQVAGF